MTSSFSIPEPDPRQHLDPTTEQPLIDGEDPFGLFQTWFKLACEKEPTDPNAMALATADSSGMPNVRMVLLKNLDATGFVFYSNKESQKGVELTQNPQASLCFHWKSLARQVRIQGIIQEVTPTEADDYFQSRPRGSRIGAWASQQSRPLSSRGELVKQVLSYTAKYAIGTIPRPDYWTGFRVLPLYIEFWENGAFRLHDRLVFERREINTSWDKKRLYP